MSNMGGKERLMNVTKMYSVCESKCHNETIIYSKYILIKCHNETTIY